MGTSDYNVASSALQDVQAERERSRRLTLMLPDLGSEQKNRKLDALLSEFAEKIARLIEDS